MPSIDQAIGERVRIYRKALGMSQTDLAEKIGVRFQQVQKYENGSNRIAASRLWQIADALNISVVSLFEGLPGTQPEPSAQTSEMIGLLQRLPEQRRTEALFYLRGLANGRNIDPK
ncbi:MAG: helix-turn-helix domain-containing protein [Rhodobacteraceae bacterium]|nr:helix-turn-helix domain-containing protein [Paracoccaceae bacterium]